MKWLELLLLAAIWGGSFLFMRIGVPELGPIPLIACRVAIAALVLLPVMRIRGASVTLRAKARPLLVVGVLNSALPFCLLAYSMLTLNAGFDSVLNAITPMWTALIACVSFQLRLSRAQILGLLLGLAGVTILVWDKLSVNALHVPLAVAAALCATASYGFAINYSKRHLAGVNPLVVAFGSQLSAALVLVPLSLFFWPAVHVTPGTWACVAALGIICTGLAYILFFRLVEHVSAAYAASVTFLIPVFGMVWGALFLAEKLTPTMLAGCLVVLLGTALASGRLNLKLK